MSKDAKVSVSLDPHACPECREAKRLCPSHARLFQRIFGRPTEPAMRLLNPPGFPGYVRTK